eukprot:720355-Prorocentrum_minimum.AAC.2
MVSSPLQPTSCGIGTVPPSRRSGALGPSSPPAPPPPPPRTRGEGASDVPPTSAAPGDPAQIREERRLRGAVVPPRARRLASRRPDDGRPRRLTRPSRAPRGPRGADPARRGPQDAAACDPRVRGRAVGRRSRGPRERRSRSREARRVRLEAPPPRFLVRKTVRAAAAAVAAPGALSAEESVAEGAAELLARTTLSGALDRRGRPQPDEVVHRSGSIPTGDPRPRR